METNTPMTAPNSEMPNAKGGLATWLSGSDGKKLVTIGTPLVAMLGLLFAIGGQPQPPAKGGGLAAPAASSGLQLIGSARAADSEVFSPEQKAAIERTVKTYFLNNPEVFEEILGALEKKKRDVEAENMKKAVSQNATALFKSPTASVVGNAKGDVTVVEFFDYNCGYCKRALSDVNQMVQTDSKLKVIFKELPILSKGSEEASRAAIAARMQGKYWEFHKVMLESQGQANEAASLKAAEKLGLDMAKFKKDMASAEVRSEIAEDRKLAERMGINGTPHFLIGDKVIPGAPDNLKEVMTGMVADIRKNGCAVC